jgi:hypothetical protein
LKGKHAAEIEERDGGDAQDLTALNSIAVTYATSTHDF